MKKTWISLLSMSLLLVLCASVALAGNQGDVGGQMAAEIAGRLQNHENNTGGLPEGIPTSGFGAPPAGTPVYQMPADVNRNNLYLPSQQQEGNLVNGSNEPVESVESNGLGNANWLNNNNPNASGQSNAPVVEGVQGNADQSTTTSGTTTSLDWFVNGQALLKQYPNLKIYDINTGVSWSATYINGKNHADIIPASEADAAKLTANNITGSYVRRPVIVTVNGEKYAGSMYAVGHGNDQFCSYFNGVMCIHFTGSMTHSSQNVDKDHQAAIQDALGSGY